MPVLTAVDLFSGAGGTTQGLRDAGYEIVSAIENDAAAAASFAANHPATDLIARDIRRVQAPALARRLVRKGGRLDLLTACPPCQPFSTLGTGNAADPRNALVSSVSRFVEHLKPRLVVVENVPGLRSEPRFLRLVEALRQNYDLAEYLVQATDFGVPQHRRRIILIGVERRIGATLPSDLPSCLPCDFDRNPQVAGDVLPLPSAIDPSSDPVHKARTPQPITLRRIRAIKQGQGRLQLPPDLELSCHSKLETRNATSVYGRIDPDRPAPTMTTRCTTPSCGRFIHPTEDRGLTLREAALLQTFPLSYKFHGTYGEIERQIGNAVPPKLAHALGLIAKQLLTHEQSTADNMLAAA